MTRTERAQKQHSGTGCAAIWRVTAVVLGLAALYAIVAILWTWPLLPNGRSQAIGTGEDRHYFAWLLGWFQEAVFDPTLSPMFVEKMNYPYGFDLAYVSLSFVQFVIGLPVVALLGEVAGYNFVLLASFVLSGLGMSAWAYYHTRRWGPSAVAGLVFALLPYRNAHISVGHIELAATQFLPMYFLGLDMLVEQKGGWKGAVVAGLGYGLVCLSAQYYMYMTFVMTLPYLMVRLWPGGIRHHLRYWRMWLLAAALMLPLVLLAEYPYLRLSMSGESSSLYHRSIEYLGRYCGNPYDILLPPANHWLWPSPDRPLRIGVGFWESTLYVGVLPLVLLIVGLVRRAYDREKLPQLSALAVGALVAAILACGPWLQWQSEYVMFTPPSALQGWLGAEPVHVPMPGMLPALVLPYYTAMRVGMRYGLYAGLFLSLSVGLVIADLLPRGARWGKRIVGLGLVPAAIMIGFYEAPVEMSPLSIRPAHRWMAQQPGKSPSVFLDHGANRTGSEVFASWKHDKYTVGSFGGANNTPHLMDVQGALVRLPSDASWQKLIDIGVQYLWVRNEDHERDLDEPLGHLQAHDMDLTVDVLGSYGLALAYQDGLDTIYELDPARLEQLIAQPDPVPPHTPAMDAWFTDMVTATGWLSQDVTPRMLADVNGDGRDDLVGIRSDGVWVSLSDGARFAPRVLWSDGLGNMAWPSQTLTPRLAGDVDGDGHADLVGFGPSAVLVALSDGEAFDAADVWLGDLCLEQGYAGQDVHPRFVADVDGDGLDDIVAIGERSVVVAISTGDGFAAATVWLDQMSPAYTWDTMRTYPRAVADVTGDGRADLLGFGQAGIYLCASDGTSFSAPALWSRFWRATETGWPSQAILPRLLADISGDGKADVVGFGMQHTYVAVTSDDGSLGPIYLLWRAYSVYAGGWRTQDHTPRLMGDVDGDGRAEVIGLGGSAVFVTNLQNEP